MRIRASFFFFALLFSLFISHSFEALALFIAAVLHELGHVLAAYLCDIPLDELRLGAFGASITPKYGLSSYKKEIFLALGGPLSNVVCAVLILPFAKSGGFSELIFAASLFLSLVNLLPIDDLDGGRVLKCALLQKLSPSSVDRACSIISFFLVLTVWLISVYLLLRRSLSLSLFTFSLSLFCKIFLRQKN